MAGEYRWPAGGDVYKRQSYNIVANDLEFFTLLINKYVDIVFANEEEAKAFTGKEPELSLIHISSYQRLA